MPPTEALGQAASALDSGRPRDAFALCGEVLARQPDNAEALNLAGVAAFQTGDAAEARSLLETAIAFRPGFADALNNLGNVLKAGGGLNGPKKNGAPDRIRTCDLCLRRARVLLISRFLLISYH